MARDNYFGNPLPPAEGMVKGKPQPNAGVISPFDFSDFPAGIGMTLDDLWGIYFGPNSGVFGSGPTGTGQERAKLEGSSVGSAILGNASDVGRNALGINPEQWQTFIRQTATDWGIYVGLFALLILGMTFLVSATGGGTPQQIIRKATK